MQTHFTAEFFKNNRQRLQQSVTADGPIVITANGLLQRGGDSCFAFSQDANFWYLTGIDEPDITLVIDEIETYLIVPARDASRTAFDGAVDDEALSERSGIATILELEAGWQKLADRLKSAKQVITVAAAPAYIERHGLYVNPARGRLVEQLKTAAPGLKIHNCADQLVAMRMFKQAPELTAIQSAIDITIASIQDATRLTQLNKYEYEYQLEAAISHGFRSRGAQGHSFDPIVAGGERACTLHNVANNDRLADGELIVIDVGSEVEHYAADITRTVAKGVPGVQARQIHAAVADVQQYALSLVKPGIYLHEYEEQVEVYMGKTLQRLKLIKTASHENIRKYYPHATSHFLGLNVHDAGHYDQPLAPGMVITVEPGIYVPELGIGVRIEDDVLINAEGNEILSAALTSKLL